MPPISKAEQSSMRAAPPCFAAIGAMRAEMKSRKWLFAGIALQLTVGYCLSFLVYFFGTLFTVGHFASAWIPILGWIIVTVCVVTLILLILRKQTELNKQTAEAVCENIAA